MLDVVIIGGGPAGLAAAVYFARQKLKFTIITGTVGGYALLSDDIENYLGFHMLKGIDLVGKFKTHLKDYEGEFEMREGELVTSVTRREGGFTVTTDKGKVDAKAVLIATGTTHRTLNVSGEKELYGHGVTYCASCDAPLFKGKKVYVIGGGNSAMDAALFLEKYADQVILVTVNNEMKGDAGMKSKVTSSKKIRIYSATKTTKIIGDAFVSGIGLVGPDGVERVEPAEGVFVEIGLQPVSNFITIVQKDKNGQIVVDKRNATSEDGIFAAGDVTDVMQKQIAVAVGEGSKAAMSVIYWLQSH